MSEREISDAVLFIAEATPQHREKYGTTIEKGRERLRTAARAITQLWYDLEQEEPLISVMERIAERLEKKERPERKALA